MGVGAGDILYYLVHPHELRAIIQWRTWHNPVHERDETKESEALKRCFYFLDQTSRSFTAVIQELHPELLVPVVIFYLILRGLDTVEDDMSIPLEIKEPLLRSFHTILEQEGWKFEGNGPNERDRQLLVEFSCVIEEFRKLPPVCKEIIVDVTQKMGNGMADYATNADISVNGVNTVKEYDKYCYYVAGLVGEGCTRLFVQAKRANPVLLDRTHLHESMGLFLQKVNIIRDIHEDWKDKRRFWPKEIWSKHVSNFDDLFKPENRRAALNCSSEMILNALGHVEDCLAYLAGLREQSVFNFCAIPQTMAIATLDLCFQNPKLFSQNIKITKGAACKIMTDSTQNLRVACEVFRRFTQKIQRRNDPRNPNFLKISIRCGKIEQFIQSLYPVRDPKAELANGVVHKETAEEIAKAEEAKWDTIYMMGAVFSTLFFLSLIMILIAYYMGARFQYDMSEVQKGKFSPPVPSGTEGVIGKYDRQEL